MKTTTDELLTFITIVDSGSITTAADRLNQTTSGVSRTLSRLEKKLDTTLLMRTTRKIQLTEEGEKFLEHARAIVNMIDEAEESMMSVHKRPSGVLRVDSATPFILHAVTPYMEEFGRLYPDIKLELHSSERNIDLVEKRIDVAIRMGNLSDSTLYAKSLGASRRRILASPAYLEKHGMPKNVEELSKHSLVGFTDPKELNNWPLKSKKGSVYQGKFKMTASSGETLLELALNGVGIACLSDFMSMPFIEDGRLIQVLKNHTIESKEAINAVYYRNTQLSGKISLFIDFLQKRLPVYK